MATHKAEKFFLDLSSDYWDLKYIFEYGFSLDDKATKMILGKKSRYTRELEDILVGNEQNEVRVYWGDSIEQTNVSKAKRKIRKPNHYRLGIVPWFFDLYGSYGKYNDYSAKKEIGRCAKEEKNYSFCKEDGSLCGYRNLCRIHEELQDAIKNADKQNEWTFSFMWEKQLIQNKEEYQSFLKMIYFFANFTPLSVLGSVFLRHLGVLEQKEIAPPIFVRKLPPDFALEQESIYRVLRAMKQKKSILYADEEYIPIQLKYREKDLHGLEEHLFVRAKKRDSKQIVSLPLYKGVYLEVGKEVDSEELEQKEQEKLETQTKDFWVEFYYNEQTTYLKKRRQESWRKQIQEEQEMIKTREFVSPYYLDEFIWNVDLVHYQIPIQDVRGFLDFIASFGDFARLLNHNNIVEQETKTAEVYEREKNTSNRGKFQGENSLLNVYHSDEFLKGVKDVVAPKDMELEWLLLVLNNYPNIARMFLNENSIKKILEHLNSKENERTMQQHYDYSARICDIGASKIQKYREILKAINKKCVLQYEHDHQVATVFPYAMEYDVSRHLVQRNQEPMDIMVYSLDENRTIKVLYKDIRVKNQKEQADINFSDVDKLYHILAYTLRCATEELEEIPENMREKVTNVLNCIWGVNNRGNDNYIRCIKKKFLNRKSFDYSEYFVEYQELESLFAGRQKIKQYVNRVFGYWKSGEAQTKFHYWYQYFLMKCFKEACKTYLLPQKQKFFQISLKEWGDSEIWKLICGENGDGIANEIAFYNERLKNDVVSFTIRTNEREEVDKVYRLFREFLCVGNVMEDGAIRFTVTYESFYYRKIHMFLMTLLDKIEEIEPRKVAELIESRKKNMEVQVDE